MSTKEPSQVVELFERIAALLPRAIAFDGTIIRSAGMRFANEGDFLSGAGAAQFGGRWNRPGILAVYASLDILTATHEAYQNFINAGFPELAIRPRVMAGATARLSVVCDLTNRVIRQRIGFTRKELVEEDWYEIQAGGEESWTQAIARGCREAGFEALLVPSARNLKGTNIVIFPDRLHPGSLLRPLAPKDLPPHPNQWPT